MPVCSVAPSGMCVRRVLGDLQVLRRAGVVREDRRLLLGVDDDVDVLEVEVVLVTDQGVRAREVR